MHDDNPHLRSVLRSTAAESAPPDDESGLPSLQAGEYQPFARPSNKAVHALHFVDTKGEVRSFQYVHLDSDSRYEAERITLRFIGMQPTTVTVTGRNLWRLYDYVHQHRVAWIMVAPRDFAHDGEPIVSGVRFDEMVETRPTSD